MSILVFSPESINVASIRSVGDFNNYYKINRFNITKLRGNSAGAEGHYIGESSLDFGFRRFDEDWTNDLPPVFVASISGNVFSELGYSNGNYLEHVLGFLQTDQSKPNLFIAKFPYRQISKKEYREIDAMFPIDSKEHK